MLNNKNQFDNTKTDPVSIIFIPKGNPADVCSVGLILSWFISVDPNFKFVVIDPPANHLKDHLPENSFPERPNKIVLFAHPNNRHNCLFHPEMELHGQWWSKPGNTSYNFLYAHVCYGHEILKRDRWTNIFPQFVSFDKEIHIIDDGEKESKIKDVWLNLFKAIIDVISTSEKSEFYEEIEILFEQAINDLQDELKNPLLLNKYLLKRTLSNISNAFNALTSNKFLRAVKISPILN